MPQHDQSTLMQRESGASRLQHWHYFLLFWLLINGVQIAFTELSSDEGYYWFYSSHLQWGYYDHPPMVALLIRIGHSLFGGEFGVRIFNLLFVTGAIYFFFLLLPQRLRNNKLIFLLLLAAPLVNYLSFLVFPDGPLLFFSMTFLWLFRRFLKEENLFTAVLLGVSTALMFYSKYHGVLVVFFSFLALPRLILSQFYWLAMITALVLFLPHLWWQYQNDFPTFQYHLTGRSDAFSIDLALQFLSQQIVAISPALIFIPFVARVQDRFERSLLFIITGTFAFFGFTSFKTFVHFHWTSIAVFPLLYFAARFYSDGSHRKLFRSLVLPFLVLIVALRVILIFDVGIKSLGEDYYHGRKDWAHAIEKTSNGDPVFFPNNLREAPLYSFYTGKTGVTLYDRPDKKSQYELWHFEDSLQGRNVLVVNKYEFPGSKKINTDGGVAKYFTRLADFQSYFNGISIIVKSQSVQQDSVLFSLQIKNERTSSMRTDTAAKFCAKVMQGKDVVKTYTAEGVSFPGLAPQQVFNTAIKLPLNEIRDGDYHVYFGFRKTGLPDSYNSAPFPFKN